jgi:hypothetical protein
MRGKPDINSKATFPDLDGKREYRSPYRAAQSREAVIKSIVCHNGEVVVHEGEVVTN